MLTLSQPKERVPLISFDEESGILLVSGRSFMDNAVDFYRSVIALIKNELPKDKMKVVFNIEYFNTSSSKCILEIFKYITSIYDEGADVQVVWNYSERFEDMHEAGEDYKDLMGDLPFEIVEKEV